MNVQLTNYAIGLLNSSTGPITLDHFKLGSAFNYLPQPTDTDIHGTEVFSGTPSAPAAENANIVKYSIYMDYNLASFSFGEFGLYVSGNLFALGSSSELINKIQSGVTVGNSIRLDVYLSMVGTNYNMWFDLAESDNKFRMATLESPDVLPPSANAVPNAYIVQGADTSQSAVIAYTDRLGLWNFDAYQYGSSLHATVTAADFQSVTIAIADYSTDMVPAYFGQLILEFTTGPIYSICRYVKTTIVSGGSATLGFNTALAIKPNVGDKFILFRRTDGSTTHPNIPIATATTLGGIKIGTGLVVQLDGTCSVDPHAIGLVTSVNGQVGDVIVNAGNLPGLATVGKTGDYNDLINKPAPFVLPPMSTTVRGGAKLPLNGNLIITGTDVLDLGFSPVKTVNSTPPDANGNVNLGALVIGLVNPQAVTSGADLNTYNTTGLFSVAAGIASTIVNKPNSIGAATVEVIPLSTSPTGDVIQRWTTDLVIAWRKLTGSTWTPWSYVATNAVATTSSLGVVQIGNNINVTGGGVISVPTATSSVAGVVKPGTALTVAGDGTLSLDVTQIPVATTTTVGVVKVGSGLAVDGTGNLTVSLPIATATVLGGVKIGSGVTVAGDGTISVGSDASKLNRVNGIAQGIYLTFLDQGTIAGSTVTFNKATADVNAATFSGSGAVTWSLTGWPASGTYGEVQIEVINGGTRTHTFPGAVRWVNPDGTTTTTFATYMTNQRSTTNFQTSGIDFVIFWSHDGGTTIYGKVM